MRAWAMATISALAFCTALPSAQAMSFGGGANAFEGYHHQSRRRENCIPTLSAERKHPLLPTDPDRPRPWPYFQPIVLVWKVNRPHSWHTLMRTLRMATHNDHDNLGAWSWSDV